MAQPTLARISYLAFISLLVTAGFVAAVSVVNILWRDFQAVGKEDVQLHASSPCVRKGVLSSIEANQVVTRRAFDNLVHHCVKVDAQRKEFASAFATSR